MTYLALDQAPSVIGWAIGSPDTTPRTGTQPVPKHGENYGATLSYVSKWLTEACSAHHVRQVVFESPFIGGLTNPTVVRSMCSLADHIDFWCFSMGIPCREVSVQTWRKHFLGRGTAPRNAAVGPKAARQWLKTQAMTACAARRWDVRTDHEADACGILDYVLACDFPDYAARTAPLMLELAE